MARRHTRLLVAACLATAATAAGACVTLAERISDPDGLACVDTGSGDCYGDVTYSGGGNASVFGGSTGGGTGVAVAGGQGSATAPGEGGTAVTLGSGNAGGSIAASTGGNACNSGYSRLALSPFGQAGGCASYDCAEVAVSDTGGACGEVAVTNSGSATAAPDPACESKCPWLPGFLAVSGSGSSTAAAPNSAALSGGSGSATGGSVAVSQDGDARACGGAVTFSFSLESGGRGASTCRGSAPVPILVDGVSGPGFSAS